MRYSVSLLTTILLLCMGQNLMAASEENADRSDTFKAAAPMNQTVKITRTGNVLRMDYELIGADGKKYDINDITGGNYNKKPSVAIYKGDMQVCSGTFEYG